MLVPSAINDPCRYKVPYAAPAETEKAQKQPTKIALKVKEEGALENEEIADQPSCEGVHKVAGGRACISDYFHPSLFRRRLITSPSRTIIVKYTSRLTLCASITDSVGLPETSS